MRIDDLNPNPLTQGAVGSTPGSTPKTQGSERSGQTAQRPLDMEGVTGSDRPDQAEVSPLAQSLAAPDASRIEQLRMQVESGSYQVSAQSVASALIDAHLMDAAHLKE